MTTGPDLTVELEEVEYEEEAEKLIAELPYRFPTCGSCG